RKALDTPCGRRNTFRAKEVKYRSSTGRAVSTWTAKRCVKRMEGSRRYITSRPSTRSPRISIMVITHNHAKYIDQALQSILMQETEYDYEINVVDDGSTDGA